MAVDPFIRSNLRADCEQMQPGTHHPPVPSIHTRQRRSSPVLSLSPLSVVQRRLQDGGSGFPSDDRRRHQFRRLPLRRREMHGQQQQSAGFLFVATIAFRRLPRPVVG